MNKSTTDNNPRLAKAKIRALENVWLAEVEGRMFQSRAKIYTALTAEGYVEPDVQKFPTAFGIMTCHGIRLTHIGRFAYCSTCCDPEDLADAPPSGHERGMMR